MASPTNSAKPDLSSLRISDAHRNAGSTGKRLGIVALIVLLLAGAAGAIWAFRGRKPQVQVAVAQKPDSSRPALLNASGYITPRREATVAAKITGRVTGIFFDEGVHVRKDQILATLDDSDVQRALESAKADRDSTQAGIEDLEVQLKYADVELHRAEELQTQGVESQEFLDTARTNDNSLRAKISLTKVQVLAAESRIREAQQAVDNCVIRAPFDGIMVTKDAQVGEMVSPISAGGGFTRTGIGTVVDMNSLEIEVDVNEAYIARVEPGQPVTAVLDAYPDWQIPSRVRTVIPTADREKATVKVRISFLKLDPRMLPDMGIKVAFLGDTPNEQKGPAAGVVIPADAVHDDSGAKIVFLVKDDHVERQAITLGQTRGADVEVIAGLSAGDTVVVKSPGNLRDGEAIEIQK
ncbi:MAG: efflux RND transporter periplasmic adaptor subunit [Candidatus Acidiferrales bacterium]